MDEASARMLTSLHLPGGAVAQLGARLDGIEEVVGSNPIGSTKYTKYVSPVFIRVRARKYQIEVAQINSVKPPTREFSLIH